MRGHPLFDFEQRRKQQQRDSDLDMLVRGRYEHIGQLEQQLTFFLARYPGQGRGLPSAWKRYADVCEAFLRTRHVPERGEDAARAVRLVAKFKDWLGHGGSAQTVARDLLETAMVKPASRGDWALLLVQAWPEAGRRVVDNLAWACSLREPDLIAQRPAWHATLNTLIELALAPDGEGVVAVKPGRTLLIVEQLWKAGGQSWVPTDEQLQRVETLFAQSDLDLGVGQDGQRVGALVAWVRRDRLAQLAQSEQADQDPGVGSRNLRM